MVKDPFLRLLSEIDCRTHRAKELSSNTEEHIALDSILVALSILRGYRSPKLKAKRHD